MPRYLIEIPHEATKKACDSAVNLLKSTGSHFLTHADFGCPDNVHKAWVTVEVDRKEMALMVVPVPYRNKAKITRVTKFSMDKVDKYHKK